MKFRAIAVELGRIIIGATFALSGLMKAIDPIGMELKIREFLNVLLGAYASWFLPLSLWMAFVLIVLEFSTGAFLLMGIYRRLSSRLAVALLFFFTLLTGYSFFTGAVSDCGCFGDAIKLSAWETFLKNLILFPIAVFLTFNATKIKHLYSLREQWIPALSAIIGIAYFVYSNASTLPYIDFRPYKVGYNLKDSIAAEDSSYQAELLASTRYVYKKDKVQKSFAVDSLPDSTWTFVEMTQPQELQERKLRYSFLLLDGESQDVSADILDNKEGVFLLLSPDWTKASQDKYESINDLYRYLSKTSIKLYAVSPSDSVNENYWRYQTGAEYPSLVMDATTIKTITRSNPGLVFIKNGCIIDKIPSAYFPKKEEIANFVQQRLTDTYHITPGNGRIALLVLWSLLWLVGIVRRALRYVRALFYQHYKLQEDKQNA